MTEHQDAFESLGAFVLGALPDHEAAAVAAHVESCPVCAEDAAALRRAAAGLLEDVPVAEPPPELRDRIMAVVEREAAMMRVAAPQPAPRPRRPWATAPVLRLGLAAACALAIGGVVGASVFSGDGGGDTRTLAAEAGRGQAWVELDGDRAQLVVDGLAAPGEGKVYELWVQSGDAAPRPANTDLHRAVFVVSSGRVEIPARLRPGDRVMVTAEPAGGSRVPTAAPIVVTERV